MPTAKRICKVCGKEYDYCKTWNNTNKFRWQDVACNPVCGEKYFALIEASRNPEIKADEAEKKPVVKKPRKKSPKKETTEEVLETVDIEKTE